MKIIIIHLCLLIIFFTSVSATSLFAKKLKNSSHPYHDIILVSDLDDTLKITNVANPNQATYNGIFSEKIFAGMDELYRNMIPQNHECFIISGSPGFLHHHIQETLAVNNLPRCKIILKQFREDTSSFKTTKIKELMMATRKSLILLGDDTENDVTTFLGLKQEFPDRILAIYIHSVLGKDLPPKVKPFLISYDVAVQEQKAGRLHLHQLDIIKQSILMARRETVVPDFVSCNYKNSLMKYWPFQIADLVNSCCESDE